MTRSTKRYCGLSLGFTLGALATAAAVHAQPRMIYVDAHAPAGGTGTAWSSAFRDLQYALAVANSYPQRVSRGVEIRIAQGVYTPDQGTLNRDLSFVLTSAVTLMGGFAGLLGSNPNERDPRRFVSVLSGDLNHDDGPNFTNYSDNSRTIVLANMSDLSGVLDGLEISGGSADADGGGFGYVYLQGTISTFGSSTTIGQLTIRNCTITRNRAVTGAVLNLRNSRVSGSRVVDNRALGSGIVKGSGNTFDFCVVRGNRPSNAVFQIVKLSGLPAVDRLTECLIADNLGSASGAFSATEPGLSLELIGCTVVNNTAPSVETIWFSAGAVKLRNCIIARNVVTSFPESHTQIAVQSAAWLDVNSSVLIDNGAAGVRFLAGAPTPLPIISGDAMFVFPDGTDGDPNTWQDNDYHLRPGSPAIDRADSAAAGLVASSTDLDNAPLYDDPATPNRGTGPITYADLGCYEFQGALCPADFDFSRTLTITDIFAFLNAWLAGDPRADFDRGGSLSTTDVLAFVSAWMHGC